MSTTTQKSVPSKRIANATGMSVSDKAFLQIVYSCVLLSLYSTTPTNQPPTVFTLRLTNCNGCGKNGSANAQYQIQPSLLPIIFITQFANSPDNLKNFIQSILTQVLVSKDYNLAPVQMFFSNFQTSQDLQITLFNHISPIDMGQLQNVVKIAASGVYDIRNYDCTVNGSLTINPFTIVSSFADQITAVISKSASHCIVAAKYFPFFAYDSDNKIIQHPMGKNISLSSNHGSFCVINTTNSIIDAITFELAGNMSVYAVYVWAIDETGAAMESESYYTSNNIFHTFSVNPGQGYAIQVNLNNGQCSIYVTGMTVSYMPYTPPVSAPVKNTYDPPLPGQPFLIKWRGQPWYLGVNGMLTSKERAYAYTYDNVNNIISPPIFTTATFVTSSGSPISFQILSYGNSALLANTGYPGQKDGAYAYSFQTNSTYYQDPNWFAPLAFINGDVESAIQTQSDQFVFDYEYVIITKTQTVNPNVITSNYVLANSTILSYTYNDSNTIPVSGDIFSGGYDYSNPNADMGYYATNTSTSNITLMVITLAGYLVVGTNEISYPGQISYGQTQIFYNWVPGDYIITPNIVPGGQFYVASLGFNAITVKPYVLHSASNHLNANEYMTSGSVTYMPQQGVFVSSGDALWDSTETYFLILFNGDLCLGSKHVGISFSSNPLTANQGAFVVLTNDGKLSVINRNGVSIWNSNNLPFLNTKFGIQENGDYVIFNGTNPIWSQGGMVAKSNSIPLLPNPTPPVPAGTLPLNGKNFVVASAATGKYLCDDGVMSTDITKAKVFTYNTALGYTNELLETSNTVAPYSSSPAPTNLIINFSGINALVGTTYGLSNNIIAYGIILGSGNNWNFGTVNYNVPAALGATYYNSYAAVLYYV